MLSFKRVHHFLPLSLVQERCQGERLAEGEEGTQQRLPWEALVAMTKCRDVMLNQHKAERETERERESLTRTPGGLGINWAAVCGCNNS